MGIALGAVAMVGVALLLPNMVGCMVPGPAATQEQIGALRRQTTDSIEHPVSYLVAGDPARPRVIYVHGTPGDAGAWADFLVDPVVGPAASLAGLEGERAEPLESIAIDRPGFGMSEKRATVSFEEQAMAIAPLLVERDGEWPILVGHSLGGPIVARVAADHPDRVRALVIVGGSLDPVLERPGLMQRIAQGGVVRAFLPRALDNSLQELKVSKRETLALAEQLGHVRCPVIIIHGTKDSLVPYANVEYMERMLANAPLVEVVTLENQGHFVPWEHPDVIRAAIERLAAMP